MPVLSPPDRDEIIVALAKGVVDLVGDRGEGSGPAIAKIDAERVEDITKYAGHRQQSDRAAVRLDPRRRELMLDLNAERLRTLPLP